MRRLVNVVLFPLKTFPENTVKAVEEQGYMGDAGIEPATSCMSSKHSNQLS
jgi:hypothetical protein